MSIALEEEGDTLLTGAVVDQAALHGLLKRVRDLGVPLVSVNRLKSARRHDQQKKEIGMRTYRGNAIAAGVMLIACTATAILYIVPLGGPLTAPVDLAKFAANENGVLLAALIQFIWAATGAGIAVALFPVLKRHSRALALGSGVARAGEAVLVLVGTLVLLVLFSLSQGAVAAGSAGLPSADTLANLLVASIDWLHGLVVPLAFALGAFLYYLVLFKSRLIPRWLAGWGLVAIGLNVFSTLYGTFAQDFSLSSVSTMINLPILLQEMVLAIWLIAKGFDRSALASRAESEA